jgi:hypothetical protein
MVPAVPDAEARTRAFRVIDAVVPGEDCSTACAAGPQDSIRDTLCLQEAIAQGLTDSDYGATELPAGNCFIDETLEILDTWSFELYGYGIERTNLIWNRIETEGEEPVEVPSGPMLRLGDARSVRLHDFSIRPNSGRQLQTAILVENCTSCSIHGGDVTPSANIFERIRIEGRLSEGSLIDGIVVTDSPSPNNNDFHTFRNIDVALQRGDAFRMESPQHKTNLFEQCSCLSDRGFEPALTRCVDSKGCFTWTGGGGGYHSDYDFVLGDGCPYAITGANFEGSHGFIRLGAATNGSWSGVTVSGSRWASNGVPSSPTTDVIYVGHSGSLALLNSLIGEVGTPKPIAFRLEGGGTSIAHTLIGNLIGSTLSPQALVPVYYPSTNRGNVLWSSSGQSATKPLELPLRTLGGTSTPSVQVGLIGDGDMAALGGGAAITDLVDGFDGQSLTILALGSSRTVQYGAGAIELSDGQDFPMTGNDTLTLKAVGGTWVESGRTTPRPKVQVGASATAARTALVLVSAYPNVVTSGTTEETLYSYTIPANTLATSGDRIVIEPLWRTLGSVGTRSVRVRIAGMQTIKYKETAAGYTLDGRVTVVRSGADTQRVDAFVYRDGIAVSASLGLSYSEDEDAGITVTVTGESATAGDIRLESLVITYYSAN